MHVGHCNCFTNTSVADYLLASRNTMIARTTLSKKNVKIVVIMIILGGQPVMNVALIFAEKDFLSSSVSMSYNDHQQDMAGSVLTHSSNTVDSATTKSSQCLRCSSKLRSKFFRSSGVLKVQRLGPELISMIILLMYIWFRLQRSLRSSPWTEALFTSQRMILPS